jgi:shikimate dehydrogenase
VYFEEKFSVLGLDDCRFEKFQLDDVSALDTVLKEEGLKGFCVTIPYKKEIMERLDKISDEARAIGAVNCIKVANGKLSGYNTDAHGFRVGLDKLLGDARPRALVLGTGGASAAVCYVLEQSGIDYRMVSRMGGDGLLRYEELTSEEMESHRLIINATPLGTFPNLEERPAIPYDAIDSGHYLYDLVYNPPITAFLAEGQKRGAKILNGEKMFRTQAEKNWTIWNS